MSSARATPARTRPVQRALLATAAGAAALGAAAVLTDQAPYPYALHRLLDLPLPLLSGRRLDVLLDPRRGQKIVEIGPGTGLQALHVAPQLGPEGELAVVDVQQQMLDHVMARAASRSCGNIRPCRADARQLPFATGEFDAAYMVTVLGEIPARAAALREVRRVLKPGGRLVIGEFADRHLVPLQTLVREANDAGLHLRRITGLPLAYYALFEPCAGTVAQLHAGDRARPGETAADRLRQPGVAPLPAHASHRRDRAAD